MLKKLLIILVLFLLGIAVIYYPELNRKIFKNKVYLVYDLQKDSTNIIDWSKFGYLLQDDFEPNRLVDYKYEGPPLDEITSKRVDSIIDLYNKATRKFINKHGNKLDFGIQISLGEEYVFDYDEFKVMENRKSDELTTMPIDSVLELLDESVFDEKFQFFIVVPNFKNNNKTYMAKVKPTLIIQ